MQTAARLDAVNGPQDQATFIQIDADLRGGNCMVYGDIFQRRQRALARMMNRGAENQQAQQNASGQDACVQSVTRAEGMAAKAQRLNWNSPNPGNDRTRHPLEEYDKEVASLIDRHCGDSPALKSRVERVTQTLNQQIAQAKASGHDLGYSFAQAAAAKAAHPQAADPAQCNQILSVLEQQLQAVAAYPPGTPVYQLQMLKTYAGMLREKRCESLPDIGSRAKAAEAKVAELSAGSNAR